MSARPSSAMLPSYRGGEKGGGPRASSPAPRLGRDASLLDEDLAQALAGNAGAGGGGGGGGGGALPGHGLGGLLPPLRPIPAFSTVGSGDGNGCHPHASRPHAHPTAPVLMTREVRAMPPSPPTLTQACVTTPQGNVAVSSKSTRKVPQPGDHDRPIPYPARTGSAELLSAETQSGGGLSSCSVSDGEGQTKESAFVKQIEASSSEVTSQKEVRLGTIDTKSVLVIMPLSSSIADAVTPATLPQQVEIHPNQEEAKAGNHNGTAESHERNCQRASVTSTYHISIHAPFDFPQEDQGYASFVRDTSTHDRATVEEERRILWNRFALLPAGFLDRGVELLGNRSETLSFDSSAEDPPTRLRRKISKTPEHAFPGLPQRFEKEHSAESKPRRPPAVHSSFSMKYTLSMDKQIYWNEHISLVIHLQSCVRRKQAISRYINHRRRHRIALELWTTEQTYIKSLRQLCQIRKRLEASSTPILTALEIKSLFSDTETILLYAIELESKIRPKLEKWHVDQTLAHIFTEIQPFFQVYTHYMIQYNASQATYMLALRRSSFQNFLQACLEDFGFDIQSLLITPVQRIPRYILLLDALAVHTPASHPDHMPLYHALESMKRFATSANQAQRNYERYQAILRIHELMFPQLPNFVVPHRYFQGCGSLLLIDGSKVMRRNQRKVRQVFLFNDMLLITKHLRSENKYHLKVLVILAAAVLDHSPDTPDGEEAEQCFKLRHKQRADQSVLLKARSLEDKMAWVIAIERQLDRLAQPLTARELFPA